MHLAKYLVAALAGVAYCLGFSPFEQLWLPLLAIALLFYLANDVALKPAWLLLWFGLGKYGFGASWVYVSIHDYGNAAPLLAGFLVVLFVIVLAVLFAWPLGAAYGYLRDSQQRRFDWRGAVLFAGLFTALEWVSTWLFTGFPWLLLGNAALQTPWSSLVPVFGVLGASWWLCLSATLLCVAVVSKHWRLGLIGLLPTCLALGLGQVRWVEPGPSVSVALVQGNLDQRVKWQRDQQQFNVQRHVNLSEPHWDAQLIVWPEAAITVLQHQAEAVLEALAGRAIQTDTSLVLGIPGIEWLDTQGEDSPRYEFKNLAIAVGTARGRYAKEHLVPFGEYVPLAGVLRGLIEFFDLPMSSSTPGASDQPNLVISAGQMAMAICYEVAYPETMRRKARTAAVLATISNDTWFGASIGPLQHLQIARARALENGRWMLRSTNNGVTAIIDHQGRLQAQLPQFEADVLRGSFQVMSGRTPYNRWGHWPVLLLLVLGVLLGAGRQGLRQVSGR